MRFSAERLQRAIRNREFIPFYQPLCQSLSGCVVGCEVLARWRHPERGLLRAGMFIDSIESAGLTDELLRMLMGEVQTDVRSLLTEYPRPFILTLNISPGQVMNPVSRNYLLALYINLNQSGVIPVFEVTEREDIRRYPEAENVFAQLVQHGMQFAVDDFGVGYADRCLLNTIHASFIKIDRQFTADPTCQASARFIDDVVSLGRISGARVIAEGVETAAQAAHLRKHGVDFLQGYHCGSPMPAGLFYYQLDSQPVLVS